MFNLDREFIKWFYEDIYPDLGSNRCQVHEASLKFTPNVDTRDYWMRESFKAGAQAMWQEINAALLDWTCAVEGCNPEQVEPCEIFDRARENLYCYVHEQLDLF